MKKHQIWTLYHHWVLMIHFFLVHEVFRSCHISFLEFQISVPPLYVDLTNGSDLGQIEFDLTRIELAHSQLGKKILHSLELDTNFPIFMWVDPNLILKFKI